jgi:hypothetical protein
VVTVIDVAAMPYEPSGYNARNMRTGRKNLREAEALPGLGYFALVVEFLSGNDTFTAPRHRHDFEQIRYAMRGALDFGPGCRCEEGDIAYFPAGAYYGPETIQDAEMLLLQWSSTWVTRAQNRDAIIELEKSGSFSGGMYVTLEPGGTESEVDAMQAVWEYVNKAPLVCPQPRYQGPIVMSPEAFEWVETGGLSRRVLGRFTERDTTIEQVRWETADAGHPLSPDRTWFAMVLQGTVSVGGKEYGEQAAIWSEVNEVDELRGSVGAVALKIGFPTGLTRTMPAQA